METRARLEHKEMPKVQKTILVAEDLHKLVQVIEQRSGASFTRIMTAALIAYLFENYRRPDPDAGMGPNTEWMSFAVSLERGTINVQDIPRSLLDHAVEEVIAKATYEALSKTKPETTPPTKLEALRSTRRDWINSVKELGLVGAFDYDVCGRFPTCVKPPFSEEPKTE